MQPAPEIDAYIQGLALTSADILAFATAITSSFIAFSFFYLLGLRMKDLPIIGKVDRYTPPRYLLEFFALSLAFGTAAAYSASASLKLLTSKVDGQDLANFARVRTVPDVRDPRWAYVSLSEYDGNSNFWIYMNGRLIMSSEIHCALRVQCKQYKEGELAVLASDRQLIRDLNRNAIDHSTRSMFLLNMLPLSAWIELYLTEGENYIDIISTNSGTGGCRLVFSLQFGGSVDPGPSYKILLSSDPQKVPIAKGGTLNASEDSKPSETFYSDVASGRQIPFYETNSSDNNGRLCERIRILFQIGSTHAIGSQAEIESTMYLERRQKVCGYLRNAPRYCKPEVESR